ncbi:hypothetical protein ABKN59_007158 [Abortiporus biennis]
MVLNEYACGTSSWRSCFEMPRLNLDDDAIAPFSSSFRHLVLPSPVISHNPPNDFRQRCQSAKNLLVFSESLNANQPVFIDYLVRPYQLHNGRNIQNLFAANNFMCFLAFTTDYCTNNLDHPHSTCVTENWKVSDGPSKIFDFCGEWPPNGSVHHRFRFLCPTRHVFPLPLCTIS